MRDILDILSAMLDEDYERAGILLQYAYTKEILPQHPKLGNALGGDCTPPAQTSVPSVKHPVLRVDDDE